ncbi:MAG TPA: hypothetical protein VMX38_15365 [Verrucomicrobiae bacterium]|jgi:hypothetical protein|nr:hypothetical protein [Verrucomicrobiae bacterium]
MNRTRFHMSCLLVLGAIVAMFSACSINVQKEKNGDDKKVDISTPIGGIHVSKQADAQDVGLAIYPGATLRQKDSGNDDKSANVNISGFGYGIKVVALDYHSDDSPAKVLSFYRDQLKTYGSILECHTSGLNVNTNFKSSQDSKSLTCSGESGSNIELKVGTDENQHIVEVEPDGKGSKFSLVYVRTHGKDADI